jgi:hypothetical protein
MDIPLWTLVIGKSGGGRRSWISLSITFMGACRHGLEH